MKISRVTRSKAEAQATYDKLSAWYDALSGGSEQKFILETLTQLQVKAGESVLEVGSGTGFALHKLAQAVGSTGNVIGLDISTGMLKKSRQRWGNNPLPANLHLLCGDGMQLPFKAESFSNLFMSFTFELFDTPELSIVLQECWRVLKNAGRLGLVGLSLPEQPTLAISLYEWAHVQFPNFVDCRPIPIAQLVKDNGFSLRVQINRRMWGLPVEIVVAEKR